MTDIKARYKILEEWATSYTAGLENELRTQAGLEAIHCFVHDQFQSAYPEEHIARKTGSVFIALRFSIDLKSMNGREVSDLKATLLPKLTRLKMLRENFGDSPARLDFDWHISEMEKEQNEGREFANLVMADALTLVTLLRDLI